MKNEWLDDITQLDAVQGAFIISNRGSVISLAGNLKKNQRLEDLSVRIMKSAAVFHKFSHSLSELELFWQKQVIICKVSQNFILVTVCSSRQILPLLRITLNVTYARLLEDKKFYKLVRDEAGDRTLFLNRDKLEAKETEIYSKIN